MPKYSEFQPSAILSKHIGDDDVVLNLINQTLSALKVDVVGGNISINTSDIQIGAVEIKDHDSTERLDIVTKDQALASPTSIVISGHDGANVRLLKTDANGELQIDVLTLPNVTIGAALPAGDNNIGNVDVLTMPTTNVKTAAGDEVAVRRTALDPLNDAGVANPIKYVKVEATADGDNAVIAAVATKKIRVLGYKLQVVTTAGVFKFQDTATTPVVHAEFDGALKDQFTYDGGLDAPAFETATGEGLEINTATGVDVKGHLTYIEI